MLAEQALFFAFFSGERRQARLTLRARLALASARLQKTKACSAGYISEGRMLFKSHKNLRKSQLKSAQ